MKHTVYFLSKWALKNQNKTKQKIKMNKINIVFMLSGYPIQRTYIDHYQAWAVLYQSNKQELLWQIPMEWG